MSIEAFVEAAKAKIAQVETEIVAIQKSLDDANFTLNQHRAALAAVDGIAPELKSVLNSLIPSAPVEEVKS
jgi:hypothetical protein